MNNKQDNGSGAMLDTVVIGGGQAGLGMGYHLARQGRTFLILDAHQRVGDAWRTRWDSLRLFTPAKYDGLPGRPFPGDRLAFPHKDELADFLEEYARDFELPVILGARVDGLWREDSHYVIRAGERRWEARNVVVATGGLQEPKLPAFAAELDQGIMSLHSTAYRNPAQLQAGTVLVVGLGNSGAEIALDVSRSHDVVVAGKPSAQLPFRHGRAAARYLLPVIRFLGLYVLTRNTPLGRKVAALPPHGDPLIRTKVRDLEAAGVKAVPRVTGVRDGKPVVGEGQSLDVANVIWCTGYRDDFSWMHNGLLGDDGKPSHRRGVSTSAPGLFFLGQEFLFAAASATLPGAYKDAQYLAAHLPAPVPAAATEPTSDEAAHSSRHSRRATVVR